MNTFKQTRSNPCPCGQGDFEKCCKRYLEGHACAPTAEALMRSRYTAYSLGDSAYVLSSWHSSTRPSVLDLRHDDLNGQWIGLSVRNHTSKENSAEVEFVARYKPKGGGAAQRLHERSRFVREGGVWFYVDGDLYDQ